MERRFAHLIPAPEQALLLAAALPTGDRGRTALAELLQIGDGRLGQLPAPDRELLSLLLDGIEHNGAEAPAPLVSALRAARLHEELRSELVVRDCAAAIHELERAGARPVVVGGAGLAEHAYDGWSVRHCNALEVVVAPGHEGVATRLSGFRVLARSQLLPYGRVQAHGWLLARSVPRRVAGREVRALGDPDALLERLCAAGPHRDPSGWWAADAFAVSRRATADLWPAALDAARCLRSVLPLWVRSRWLAEHLGVPVPPSVLTARPGIAGADVRGALVGALRRRAARRPASP